MVLGASELSTRRASREASRGVAKINSVLPNGGDQQPTSTTTLRNAIALQDHWARNLHLPGTVGRGPPSLSPGAPLTLAQRYNLVARPPPLLSQEQWSEVHARSAARAHAREECPICLQAFADQEQVLLSCSHVFHKQCLRSFERFARAPCCPVCRMRHYQRRAISDGKRSHRERCATVIQAAWRGRRARAAFHTWRMAHPPAHPLLRRRWLGDKLGHEAGKLVKELEGGADDIDALFAELDASLEGTREIYDRAGAKARAVVLSRIDADASSSRGGSSAPSPLFEPNVVFSQSEWDSRVGGRHDAAPLRQQPCRDVSDADGAVDWDRVMQSALERGERDCPICMSHFSRVGGTAWLSCTHHFHVDCIAAFEAFEASRGEAPTCPVCRCRYQRCVR